jgi:dUTPase
MFNEDYGFSSPQVKIYILNENKNVPKQGHNSHGLDLCFHLNEPFRIFGHRTYCLPLGVKMFVRPQDSRFGDAYLMPRSSSSLLEKHHEFVHENGGLGSFKSYDICELRMANTFALIDWDYRGEIQGRVHLGLAGNLSSVVLDPDRAYLQLVPRSTFARFEVVDNINDIPKEWRVETKRGSGGFGSTG